MNFVGSKFVLFIFVLSSLSCQIDRSPVEFTEKPPYQYYYINDYEYLSFRYFFVDTYYHDRFEAGFSDDLNEWYYEQGTLIRELNVFRRAWYSENEARKGMAVLPLRLAEMQALENLDGVESLSGEIEVAQFVPLKEGQDFNYDHARGFFWLKYAVRTTDVLAVAYRTDTDTIGTLESTLSGADRTQFFVLRLIKPKDLAPRHEHLWQLMMKNVYFLEDTSFTVQGFNISVRKKEGLSNIQQVDPRKSFINLLGLDVTDKNGKFTNNGDGQADNNNYLINLQEGILIFPGLHPFAPLPESRFQLAEENRVEFYDTYVSPLRPLRDWDGPTKFEIVVQYLRP